MSPHRLLAAFLIVATPATTSAQTICTWNGMWGVWENPALWSPMIVPNNGTPPGATYEAIVSGTNQGSSFSINQPTTIEKLTLTGPGPLYGGSLTVNGQFSFSGHLAVQNTTVLGPCVGGGLIGGTMNVFGGLTTSGLTLGSPANSTLGVVNLAAGTSTWMGGDISSIIGGQLRVLPGASLDVRSTGYFGRISATHTTMHNDGIIRRLGNSGTTTFDRILFNNGLLDVLQGSMFFNTVANPASDPSLWSSGDIHVASGASVGGSLRISSGRLSGSGSFGAPGYPVSHPGLIQPGDNIGALNIGGPITMRGTLELELNGATQYDLLNFGSLGSMSLVNARLSLLLGYDPAPTDALTILTGTGSSQQVTGTFLNAPNNALIEVGIYNDVRYLARIRYSSNSVVLDSFQSAPIPEPCSLMLVAIAGCGIALRRRAANAFATHIG